MVSYAPPLVRRVQSPRHAVIHSKYIRHASWLSPNSPEMLHDINDA